MISPSYTVQKAIRARLIGDAAVTAIVAADRIVSTGGLPEAPFPVVLLGEDQETALGEVATRFYEVYSTLHLWTDEPGMQTVRELGGAIFGCLLDEVPSAPGIHIHSLRFVSGRYMRDPGGKLAHGVLTVRSVVEVLQ